MSRLDRHVAAVRTKLVMRQFVQGLAWLLLGAACLLTIGILIWRWLGHGSLPAAKWWLIGGGVLVVGSLIYAVIRRPTVYQAAVAIDEKLALKEKFSTALYVRPSRDVFAQAAVRDAERTADDVQLQRQFPVAFPKVGYGAIAVFVVAFLLALFVPPREKAAAALAQEKKKPESQQSTARRQIEKALAVAETAPKFITEDPKLKTEIAALTDLLKNKHFEDPVHAEHKAAEVLQDVQQALADEAAKAEQRALEQKKVFSPNFGDAKDYQTDEAKKADENLAKGDFQKAADEISKMAENFDKKPEEEKAKAAKDMQTLQKKMEAAARDPKVQQEIQKQLQQMGMNKQQAQQLQQQMQAAAQGNQQAQQQVAKAAQQMQKQLQQQMQQIQQQAKAGNPQAQQQLKQIQQQANQIQQAMQQMQGKANAQQQAQQMAQAAQQMAQAMQQQQAQANQQNPNGQGSQASQQQMAQAQASMQQALSAMQAGQSDANNVRASQQQAMKEGGDGQGDGQGNGNGNGEGEGGGDKKPNAQKGQFKTGKIDKGGGGMGGPGISGGSNGTREKQATGYDIKIEKDLGSERKEGKVLASTLIKDNHPIKGQSKVGLAQITENSKQQASDEVDEDHVSGESRKAAEEYFRTMHEDATGK